MEPKNRLGEIFASMGVEEIRFSKEQLDKWGMTSHRFNQLVANSGRLGMTIGEAKHLGEWLQQHFKGKNAYLFDDELPLMTGQQQLALLPPR